MAKVLGGMGYARASVTPRATWEWECGGGRVGQVVLGSGLDSPTGVADGIKGKNGIPTHNSSFGVVAMPDPDKKHFRRNSLLKNSLLILRGRWGVGKGDNLWWETQALYCRMDKTSRSVLIFCYDAQRTHPFLYFAFSAASYAFCWSCIVLMWECYICSLTDYSLE